MRGKTVLLNKSVSLSARKLEAKSSITSEKEQAILKNWEILGEPSSKICVSKKKEDTRVSEMLSF